MFAFLLPLAALVEAIALPRALNGCDTFRNGPAYLAGAAPNWASPPPPGFLYGFTWYYSHTTAPIFQNYTNYQVNYYLLIQSLENATEPSSVQLASWQNPTPDGLNLTTFSYLTPISNASFAFNLSLMGAGVNATGSYAALGWGSDQSDREWILWFTGGFTSTFNVSEAQLNLFSQSETGPDNTTLAGIRNCLANYSSPGLVQAFDGLYKTPVNGQRTLDPETLLPATNCSSVCRSNGLDPFDNQSGGVLPPS